MDRRDFFHGPAPAAAVGWAGCAASGGGPSPTTPFRVPGRCSPVAGFDQVFPVRRIHSSDPQLPPRGRIRPAIGQGARTMRGDRLTARGLARQWAGNPADSQGGKLVT
jgi:hypothetical protein